ncbi:MAG TPA: hypothetical protein VGJ35_13475 [Burkholderiaceae bacterium]|jgi:hypothetical protein
MPRKPNASPPTRGKTSSIRMAGRTPTLSTKAAGAATAGDAAAAVMRAPLSLATVWSQFAEQMQRASEQTWQGLTHDAEAGAEQVQRAETPQQLAGLPLGFAAEQAARWAQLSTQVTASLLDVQAAWFKEVETVATQWMGPLFARDGRITPLGSAQDIVEPPGPNGPLQMWSSAQKIWSESTKVWLQAMSHDLQNEPPASRR